MWAYELTQPVIGDQVVIETETCRHVGSLTVDDWLTKGTTDMAPYVVLNADAMRRLQRDTPCELGTERNP